MSWIKCISDVNLAAFSCRSSSQVTGIIAYLTSRKVRGKRVSAAAAAAQGAYNICSRFNTCTRMVAAQRESQSADANTCTCAAHHGPASSPPPPQQQRKQHATHHELAGRDLRGMDTVKVLRQLLDRDYHS